MLDDYKVYLKNKGFAKNTIRAYLYSIKNTIKEIGEPEKLSYIAFKNYREYLRKQDKKEVTINYRFEVIKSYLKFLYEEYGIGAETLYKDKVKLPMINVMENTSIYYDKELSINEVKRILIEAKKRNIRDYLLLFFIVSTGVRISEALQLKISDIGSKRVEVRSKGKTRYILVPSAFIKEAKAYIKELEPERIFMFEGQIKGKSLSSRRSLDIMKFYCKKAKVPENKRFLHNLRHTYTITELKSNTDIHEIASKLGHSTINTVERYGRRNERNIRAKVNETANKFKI